MEKIRFLKVLGISLFLFVSLFFTANRSLAEKPWIELGDIDESADDAQHITWEIKAEKAYDVVVYMEDDDGNEFSIVFRTRDDENEYDTSDNDRLVVGIGKEDDYYFDDTRRIYASKSFDDLTSEHSSENSSITYNFDDDTTVNEIRIYGEDFQLYSIALADTDYFVDLCWEREGSDWINFWNFENDDGKISDDTSIDFSSSYIHVTEKETSQYTQLYGGIYGGLYGMYGMGGMGGLYGSSLYGVSYRAPGTSSGYLGYMDNPPQYGMYGSYYGGYGSPYGGYGGSGYSGWGGPTYGGYSSYSSGGYAPFYPGEPQFLSTGGGSYVPMNSVPYYQIAGGYGGPTYGGWGGSGYSGWGGPTYGGYGGYGSPYGGYGGSGYSGYGGPTYGGYGGYGPSSGYSGWGGPAYGGYNPGWGNW